MPIGSSSQICNCEPSPERPSNKELIQNSLIELDREVEALEHSVAILYGSEENMAKSEIESISSFSFNSTVIEVPNIVNSLRDRINHCLRAIVQLDTGK